MKKLLLLCLLLPSIASARWVKTPAFSIDVHGLSEIEAENVAVKVYGACRYLGNAGYEDCAPEKELLVKKEGFRLQVPSQRYRTHSWMGAPLLKVCLSYQGKQLSFGKNRGPCRFEAFKTAADTFHDLTIVRFEPFRMSSSVAASTLENWLKTVGLSHLNFYFVIKMELMAGEEMEDFISMPLSRDLTDLNFRHGYALIGAPNPQGKLELVNLTAFNQGYLLSSEDKIMALNEDLSPLLEKLSLQPTQ